MALTLPHSIDEMLALLLAENYIAERSLADLVAALRDPTHVSSERSWQMVRT